MSDPEDGVLTEVGSDGAVTEIGEDGAYADAGGGAVTPAVSGAPGGTPIGVVVLRLDFCARTFGVSPCLATGTPCYNTWATCKYLSAFLKTTLDHKFSFSDAPAPFDGARPYVAPGGIKLDPTEIRSGLAFDGQPLRTVSGRITVQFEDEPDDDVGIDPYWSQRASHPGTYFKKLLARNPNYKGRPLLYYEGMLGDAEGDLRLRFSGTLQNVSRRGSAVTAEAADLLADFSKVDVPAKIDCKLWTPLAIGTTSSVTVTSLENLPGAGRILVDDEIIGYDYVDQATKRLIGLTRGMYGTAAEDHAENAAVGLVAVFGPKNPWDLWRDDLIVGRGGISADRVDLGAFSYWRNWPGGDLSFFAVIAKPVKLDKLVTEIADFLDARIWQDEQQRITVRRNMPNQPGREYLPLSDEDNIVGDPEPAVDLNEKSRITRLLVFWNKRPLGEDEDPTAYGRLDLGVDSDAEGDSGYAGVTEKKIFCRWISTDHLQEETAARYVRNLAMRQVAQMRDARALVSFELDLKDNAIKTGDHVKLTTDEILLPDGSPLPAHIYQVIKRDRKKDKVAVTLMRVSQRRVMFIAPAAMPAYDSASEAQREYGFICQADGKMPDGSPGYHIW